MGQQIIETTRQYVPAGAGNRALTRENAAMGLLVTGGGIQTPDEPTRFKVGAQLTSAADAAGAQGQKIRGVFLQYETESAARIGRKGVYKVKFEVALTNAHLGNGILVSDTATNVGQAMPSTHANAYGEIMAVDETDPTFGYVDLNLPSR